MQRASPALLTAAVALVAGTATLWPRDHPAIARRRPGTNRHPTSS
jgi:hypothetical protein